ncbi:MAG: 6,7-dimethyl-8-ribityllumazine synthase [Flavobacteriaceae bacterium]|nr:6,7-dimethyl-8-ribityllumazine synthase [Flavobacteriaceae bacterium]
MESLKKNLSEYDLDKVKSGKGLRIALIVSEWNKNITDRLYNGAIKTLLKHEVNVSDIKKINVPGSFELVYGARLAQKQKFNVIIVIGSIIKGETDHFDFISQSISNSIAMLNTNDFPPVIFCVLTDNNINQSINRSGGEYGNKGVEAAITALRMAELDS